MAAGAGGARLRPRGLRRRRLGRRRRARARPQLRAGVGRPRLRRHVRTARSPDTPRGLARARQERAAFRRRHRHLDRSPAGRGPTGRRDGGIRGAGPCPHAHVRDAGAALPAADHQPRRLARGGLGPLGRVPRAAGGRAADPDHQPAAAGLAAGERRQRAGGIAGRRRGRRSRRPCLAAGQLRHGPARERGPGARRARGRNGSDGRPLAGAGRPQWARAGARRTPARRARGES